MDEIMKIDTSMKRSLRTGQVPVKTVDSEDQQQLGGDTLHQPVSGVSDKKSENQRKKGSKTILNKKDVFSKKNITKNYGKLENLSMI